jgi:glutamine amidotransferase
VRANTKLKVAIIDSDMGNLFSVKQACEYVGLDPIITSDVSEILAADRAILPGVGAFGDVMDILQKRALIKPIKQFINSGKPFMGICLGLQLLMSQSEEFGQHQGLDVIKGSVVKFPERSNNGRVIKIPQIGWNHIIKPEFIKEETWNESPLKDINNAEFMYFVHSYYAMPVDKEVILSVTQYEDTQYCSSLSWKNIFACQFHPERSGEEGLKIFKNWLNG